MQELHIIHRFLARVRHALIRRRALETVVFAALAVVTWGLVTMVVAGILPIHPITTGLVWATLALAIAVVAWRTVELRLMVPSAERRLAQEIERVEPALRSDLVSALQFGETLPDDALSAALIKEHLRHTARETERYRGRVHTLIHTRPLQRPMAAILGVAALVTLIAATVPGQLSRTVALAFGPSAVQGALLEQSTSAAAKPALLVGNLHVSLRFPVHTRLRPRELRNASGNLEVVRGTEVYFEGRVRHRANAVSIILEHDDGTTTEVGADVVGERVQGTFAALESGTWRFRLTTAPGTVLDNDIPKILSVLPDYPPVVEIERPTGLIEVVANDVVTIHVTAVDDFGLTEIALTYGFEGVPEDQHRQLIATVEHQTSFSGTATLDLTPLELHPRDVISVRAEAIDNDDVSRPKMTHSGVLLLRVASPEDRHEALITRQQELMDQLVEVLATYLEHPILKDEHGQTGEDGHPNSVADHDFARLLVHAQQASGQRALFLSGMADVRAQLEVDTLLLKRDYDIFVSLYETLYQQHRDAEPKLMALVRQARSGRLQAKALVDYTADHRIPMVGETERVIIMLEELIAAEWMDAAQMTVDAIRDTKERLKGLLEQYRDSQDPALKTEILKEIGRLQRQMDELLARLGAQMQQIPPEHLNREGFDESPMEDLAANADSLRDLLESGDIEGALAALDRLDEGLEAMLAMTDSYTAPGGSGGPSKLDQHANELMDMVNDLAAAESALQRESEDLAQRQRQRQNDAMEEVLGPFLAKQEQRLDEIKEHLRDLDPLALKGHDRSSLAELDRAQESAERLLEVGDVEGLGPVAERVAEEAGGARRRFMMTRFDLSRGSLDRADYEQAIDSLDAVERLAEAMEDDILDLLKQAQLSPSEEDRNEMATQAGQQQKIRQQGNKLGEKIAAAGEEFPSLQEQLQPAREQADGFMGEAVQELQGGDVRGGLEGERQALRSLRAMKRNLQQSLDKERMKGRSQAGQERVVIPDAEKKAPRAFRQDILDAMKEPGIDAYKQENSLYYESLIE